MIMKTLSAGFLALTIGLTSLTPTSAVAGPSEDDALAGIIALLLFGVAVHELRDNRDTPAPEVVQPRRQRDWRVLPRDCVRHVTRANGNSIRIFGQRCLNNNYAFVNRLPEACHVRVRNSNGDRRQGYRVRCLRNQGFRTN